MHHFALLFFPHQILKCSYQILQEIELEGESSAETQEKELHLQPTSNSKAKKEKWKLVQVRSVRTSLGLEVGLPLYMCGVWQWSGVNFSEMHTLNYICGVSISQKECL